MSRVVFTPQHGPIPPPGNGKPPVALVIPGAELPLADEMGKIETGRNQWAAPVITTILAAVNAVSLGSSMPGVPSGQVMAFMSTGDGVAFPESGGRKRKRGGGDDDEAEEDDVLEDDGAGPSAVPRREPAGESTSPHASDAEEEEEEEGGEDGDEGMAPLEASDDDDDGSGGSEEAAATREKVMAALRQSRLGGKLPPSEPAPDSPAPMRPVSPSSAAGESAEAKKDAKGKTYTVKSYVFGKQQYKIRFFWEVLLRDDKTASGEAVVPQTPLLDAVNPRKIVGSILWFYIDDPNLEFISMLYAVCSTPLRTYADDLRNKGAVRAAGPVIRGKPSVRATNVPAVTIWTALDILLYQYLEFFGISRQDALAYGAGRDPEVAPAGDGGEGARVTTDCMGSIAGQRSAFEKYLNHFQNPACLAQILSSLGVCAVQCRSERKFSEGDQTGAYTNPLPFAVVRLPWEEAQAFNQDARQGLFQRKAPVWFTLEITRALLPHAEAPPRRVADIGTAGAADEGMTDGSKLHPELGIPYTELPAHFMFEGLKMEAQRARRRCAYYLTRMHVLREMIATLTERIRDEPDDPIHPAILRNCQDLMAGDEEPYRLAALQVARLQEQQMYAFETVVTSPYGQSTFGAAFTRQARSLLFDKFGRAPGTSLDSRLFCMCVPPNSQSREWTAAHNKPNANAVRIRALRVDQVMAQYNTLAASGKLRPEHRERMIRAATAGQDIAEVARGVLLDVYAPQARSSGTRLSPFSSLVGGALCALMDGSGITGGHYTILFLWVIMAACAAPANQDLRSPIMIQGKGGMGKSHALKMAAALLPEGWVDLMGNFTSQALFYLGWKTTSEGVIMCTEMPVALNQSRDKSGSILEFFLQLADRYSCRHAASAENGEIHTKKHKTVVGAQWTFATNESIPDQAVRDRFANVPYAEVHPNQPGLEGQMGFGNATMSTSTTQLFRMLSTMAGFIGRAIHVGLVPTPSLVLFSIFSPEISRQKRGFGLAGMGPRDILRAMDIYRAYVIQYAAWVAFFSELSPFNMDKDTFARYQQIRGTKHSWPVGCGLLPSPDHPGLCPTTGRMLDRAARENYVFPDLLVVDPATTGGPVLTPFPSKPPQSTRDTCYAKMEMAVVLPWIMRAGRLLGPNVDIFIHTVTLDATGSHLGTGIRTILESIFRFVLKITRVSLLQWGRWVDQMLHLKGGPEPFPAGFSNTDVWWITMTTGVEAPVIDPDVTRASSRVLRPGEKYMSLPTPGGGEPAQPGVVPDFTMASLATTYADGADMEGKRVPYDPSDASYLPQPDLKGSTPTDEAKNFVISADFFPVGDAGNNLVNPNYIGKAKGSLANMVSFLTRTNCTETRAAMSQFLEADIVKLLDDLSNQSARLPVLPNIKTPVTKDVLAFLLHRSNHTTLETHSQALVRKTDQGVYFNIWLVLLSRQWVDHCVLDRIRFTGMSPRVTLMGTSSDVHPAARDPHLVNPDDTERVLVSQNPAYINPSVRNATLIGADPNSDMQTRAIWSIPNSELLSSCARMRGGSTTSYGEQNSKNMEDLLTEEFNIENGFVDGEGPERYNSPVCIANAFAKVYEDGGAYASFTHTKDMQYPAGLEGATPSNSASFKKRSK